MSTVVVTGGTGTLGREVVRHLVEDGHDVVVTSRSATPSVWDSARTVQVDYRSPGTLRTAFEGADAIVHCATRVSGRRGGDVDLTGRVLDAARHTGCGNLVYISIVGVDRIPLRYYRTKIEAERLIEEQWSTVDDPADHPVPPARHPAAERIDTSTAGLGPGPLRATDRCRRGGRAAGRTGHRAPAGRVPDMGGPEILAVPDLARRYLEAIGRHRLVRPIRLFGSVYKGFRAGHHLAPANASGTITFQEYLNARMRSPR